MRSPPFVSGGPLSTHDENENGTYEDYTHVAVDDSKLE
jgi:hypothetical protein